MGQLRTCSRSHDQVVTELGTELSPGPLDIDHRKILALCGLDLVSW